MKTHRFELFADYFQFYIQDDESSAGDLSEAWTEEAVANKLAVTERAIGIGTARNMDVCVELTVSDSPPSINEVEFDKLNQATLSIETGQLVVAGCTDYYPDAARVKIGVGAYKVIVGYKNLTQVSEDELDGNDSYHIWIFPE